MRSRTMLFSAAFLLWGCGGKDDETTTDDTTDAATDETDVELTWYATCGDPACSGYSGPFEDTPLCSEEGLAVGDSCMAVDETCDLVDDCNRRLLCTDSDPAIDCPVSRAKYKRNIEYLNEPALQQLGEQALSVRIAQWNYNWDNQQHPPRLGFIIDDNEKTPAVHANGEQVDLYGYTTMTLALLQQQAKTIKTLEAKVNALEKKLQQKNGK